MNKLPDWLQLRSIGVASGLLPDWTEPYLKRIKAMTSSQLVRTKPESLGRVTGLAIPAFIRNGLYFLTELEVYADGLVECWGAVDLDYLSQRFDQQWIMPGAPSGTIVCINDVIQAKVVSCEWSYDSRSLHERLLDSVRRLNPSMDGLYDFDGEDVEVRDGVRYAKIGIIKGSPIRHAAAPSPTGKSRWAFVHDKGRVYLTALRIYADGLIDTHPQQDHERLIDLAEFEREVVTGRICVTVPDGTTIEIDGLGRMKVNEVWPYVEQSADLMKEIQDVIGNLNGQTDAIDKCRRAYQAYLDGPTMKTKELLREAYEAVPIHHRMCVGDMDTKDIPVRMIVYGEQEIEGWSHRAIARAMGDEQLPSIDIPKPRDSDSE